MYTVILMSSRKNSVRQHTITRGHVFLFSCFALLLFTLAIGGFNYGLVQKQHRTNSEKQLQASTEKKIEQLTQEKLQIESELTDVNEEMKTIHQMTEQIKEVLGILGQGGGFSGMSGVSARAEGAYDTQQENVLAVDRSSDDPHEKPESLTPGILKQEVLFVYNYMIEHQKQLSEYPSILPVDIQQANGKKHAYWYSSQFGWRLHPLTQKREFHQGLDIKAEPGVPVIATAVGTIAEVKQDEHFGKTIRINHESLLLETLYAHLQDYADNLKVGQEVTRGQLIGYVGNTGRSTGPHLHYGIYDMQKEQWVNPIKHILDQEPTISR